MDRFKFNKKPDERHSVVDADALQNALVEAGFTEYEARIYVTLLDNGTTTATDLADRASVPLPRVYDVLRDLESDGYVERIERDTIHARPRRPDEVSDRLESTGELLLEAADEVDERWQSAPIQDHAVSVVKRQETVLERAVDAIDDADRSVKVVGTHDQIERVRPALEAASDRGLSVHVVTRFTDGIFDLGLEEYATQVRGSAVPAPFVAIVDASVVCFSPNRKVYYEFGMIVDSPVMAFVFRVYFLTSFWTNLPVLYADPDWIGVFSSLRLFVHEMGPFLVDGAEVVVTVEGRDTATGEDASVTGTVLSVNYPEPDPDPERIAFDNLLSYLTLYLRADGEVVSVGGWGALYEDVEARRIVVEDVSFDAPELDRGEKGSRSDALAHGPGRG